MHTDLSRYKNFIYDNIELLEELVAKEPLFESARYYTYISKLRLAEHSFNFLLDEFMFACMKAGDITDIISSDDFHNIKHRRSKVAEKINAIISKDPNKIKVLKDLLDGYKERV
ncbi:hypothetical protein GYA37_00100 [candidate division WWE3 bacterium]|uniref:Uncharacterized protein n=1 Tax=candidate division WWE3 bacterium TaxID=2053526 RepID=A0A7X9HS90_UNCKA|nr:hypothetical protein [candidate division WWE3 bacterium]